MNWMGKMVGGTIGFALGGPIGAVAGAAFGHLFDGGEAPEKKECDPQAQAPPTLSNEKAQMTFFLAAFSMLGKLATADGDVSEPEIKSVNSFMADDLALNEQSRHVAEQIFQAATCSSETFESFAHQFFQQFKHEQRLLEMMIDILIRVSLADGHLQENEEKLILSAVHTFKMNPGTYETIKSRYVRNSDPYYAILGVSRDDSDEEIKKQYRKLAMENHPDTVAAKGLPDEFNSLAQEKFREIQTAYEAVRKERGF